MANFRRHIVSFKKHFFCSIDIRRIAYNFNPNNISGSRELRSNTNQEPTVPVYNYELANAYYNPQNRLGPNGDNAEEDLYLRAHVKSVPATGEGKFYEDYYYARNEAIEDSMESRKFHFRGIHDTGNLGKSPYVKTQPLASNSLILNHLLYATTSKPKNQNRNQQTVDYIDYYYGRKDGLTPKDQKAKKRKPKKLTVQLGQYFGRKRKARLTEMRIFNTFVTKDDMKRYEHKPADGKPVSMDYYFGINDLEEIPYKYRKGPKVSTEKPSRNGFRHRARENNAIDMDYYFDRNDIEDKYSFDEDFPDYVDIDNDRGAYDAVSRKSHKLEDSGTKQSKIDLLKPYTRVLKDMFEMKSGVLLKYDWLGSTVIIRSAVTKLLELM